MDFGEERSVGVSGAGRMCDKLRLEQDKVAGSSKRESCKAVELAKSSGDGSPNGPGEGRRRGQLLGDFLFFKRPAVGLCEESLYMFQ